MGKEPHTKKSKRMVQKILLVVIICLALLPGNSLSKETIYWQKTNWPPYQIIEGDDAGKGRFDMYVDLFQQQLPQYEHENVEMNWSRFWKGARAGKHVLNSLAIKTDERSQFATFSQVISIALPHRIIMKRSTLEELGNPESVSLAEFIKDKRIDGVLEQERSYSVPLDEILNKSGSSTNFDRKALDVKHIFKMILSGRADYTIEYPIVVDYLLHKHNMGASRSLASVRIKELPQYIPVRIAAPKTPWGLAVIEDIDKVVDSLKTTSRYLEIQKMYHSDPQELSELQTIYDELFLNKRPSVTISGITHTVTHKMVQEVLREAYKRIGYDVQITMLPAKRSLISANQGKTDGDIARIEGTDEVYPDLIMVPTPVVDFQGFAFTKSVTKEIREWSDLKGLRVGVVRGIRYSTIGTEGLNPFFANDYNQLFRLLVGDRIDVAIAGQSQGQLEIQKNFKNRGIRKIGHPLYKKPLYHFVHKKNKDLVVRLNDNLSDMAEKGEIDTILERAFQTLLAEE